MLTVVRRLCQFVVFGLSQANKDLGVDRLYILYSISFVDRGVFVAVK